MQQLAFYVSNHDISLPSSFINSYIVVHKLHVYTGNLCKKAAPTRSLGRGRRVPLLQLSPALRYKCRHEVGL
ncbi:hypothetical protein SJA_C1-01370 [Sphingobium indicum UT26S]|uniref:Uncharacterized protein n=1 Tax=Sphingobium indicum (strain DSM 16413 / CCM 7287 / MTCC 6362 / UT26 / NBRC 101211 / UT26S) TaxID=452662 RepID=D4YX89_SPHIU|nr:hypothetical protein SJA_C1-01370 [Sphingobium indicum UT26S]